MMPDKIYVLTNGTIIDTAPNDGTTFAVYINNQCLFDLLDKMKVVCGHSVFNSKTIF